MTQDEMDSELISPVLPAPPLDGWTLDNLPDNLPKHTELIRGTLVVSPQKAWHRPHPLVRQTGVAARVPWRYASSSSDVRGSRLGGGGRPGRGGGA